MQSQGLGNSARLQWWRWRKALGSVGGGLAFFAWCSTRMLETGFWDKTWCLGGWGPIQQGKGKKRVESLREGEGEEGNYASIGLHWIRQSPNSSGFSLRCNRVNGLEISEAAHSKDTHGHLHFKHIFSQVSHRIRTRWPCFALRLLDKRRCKRW